MYLDNYYKKLFNITKLLAILNRKISFYLFFVVLSFFSLSIQAEGTKEIMPNSNFIGRLNLEPSFTNFALYGCTPAERLNIHIANSGEKIYFGFGPVYDALQTIKTDLVFRIKDPSGNVVVTQTSLPAGGMGFIANYQKAVLGPSVINSAGYSALSFTPQTTGDFYIEFYFPPPYANGNRREISFFDITVTDANNNRINGRVWSKEWQFTVTASPAPNYFNNPFYGKLYIYSDDSIVTSVDFNGIKPYVFAMSANPTGTANTGNIIIDRKSKAGKHTYPQYKIFLNDPDSIVYPSGNLGMFTAPISFTGCPGTHCINVSTNKSGAIQLLIDLNGIPGYQIGTADLLIVQNVNAGTTCIPWNGLNGLGQVVANGTTVKFKATFVAGLTHLPIYDAEHNPNGYKINLVRPITSSSVLRLYWDDSNFPNYQNPPSLGCTSTSGCHAFNNMFGDMRTINTWWYSASDVVDSINFTYYRLSLDSIALQNASCPNITDGSIQIYVSGGKPPLTYNINGGAFQTSPTYTALGIGSYVVQVLDSNNCSLSDTINITSSPPVSANVSSLADTCLAGRGSLAATINSGTPPFQYLWNTSPPYTTSSINNLNAGTYSVTITDSFNCSFTFTDTVINVPSNIQVSPTLFHDTCSNNMGQILLNITNGIQPLSFSWNTTPGQTTNPATNLGAGNYTVIINEAGICLDTFTYNILNMPAPSPYFILQDKACVGDSIQIVYIGNQTPPDSFIWQFGSANILTGTGIGPYSIQYSNTGFKSIYLGVSKLGCPSSDLTDSVQIFELIPSIDSILDANCFGTKDGYVSLNVKGGVLPYSYSWNPGGAGTSSNHQLTAGTYHISIEDSIGCKAQIVATIGQPTDIITQINERKASCVYICDGALAALVTGGIPPYTYQWNPGAQNNNPHIDNLCTGVYKLQVTDDHNCIDTMSFYLGVNSPILADFKYKFHTAYTEKDIVDFTFTGFGATAYDWNFGDFANSVLQNPSHRYNKDTSYHIILIVNSGTPDYCLDTTDKWLDVKPDFSIFIPDAFTPNGDGLNDRFKVIANFIQDYHILIFNRWGQLLFESHDINDSWNGKYDGNEAPGAVYTYIIEVKGANNKKVKRLGRITLVR
jgi:gliding motility-associated-like protein